MDRPLALSVHLRYQELVTEKRVTIAFTALWLSNILLAFAFMNLPSHNDLVTVTCLTVGLILVTIAYFRIYPVVRYHQNEIHTQNQIQNGQAMQAARVKKSALNHSMSISFSSFATPNLFAGILLEVDNTRLPTLVAYGVSPYLVLLNLLESSCVLLAIS